ncbi:hypothetical protein BGZ65_003489 [Modicella reniformis]|uniref:Condensin complex subunit 2 n=1 Tax=Modicella reniformis TaxID=1440133 RepID=A0A9P6J961_9FUNG|nr:hypothetical protein BGZ65_003489 [Modicella reniformis]
MQGQTPNQNDGGNGGSTWTSPQSSSFSRFQDIEVPLGGTAELNDDAKEKSLRRRSLLDERAARRRSLLSYATDDADRRRSFNNSSNMASPGSKLRPSGPSSLLGVVEPHQTPLPTLLKVSADSFEQWLKLATDNKINANNSWNFALIDYFHEMSLLREGDSINFQKASCTLDGCVKIYTSRVDSVATETTKLLGGLATSSKGGENETGDQDDDDEQPDKRAKKKHASRSGNTLAKDFHSLTLEQFNLEFSVDPLFKKTSADFDEGGARGLLLNHLNVDAEGKIIFDAGDARDEGDEDDSEEEEEQEEKKRKGKEKEKEKGFRDVNDDEDEYEEDQAGEIPALKDVAEKAKKSKKTDIEAKMIDIQRLRYLSFLKRFHDHEDDENDPNDISDNGMDVELNPPNGFDGFDDDHDLRQADHYEDHDDHEAPGNSAALEKPEEERIEDAFGDLDDQIANQRAGHGVDNNFVVDSEDILIKGHSDIYSYFDSALMRNWAGPEHWKLRRIPKDAPEVDEDELFAPAEATSLMFTAANETENRKSKHALPDDVHFSSKQLLRMFLKPSYIIKSKTRRQQPGYLQQGSEAEAFNLTFPDEQFWATHTNNVNDNDVAALTDQLDQTQIYNDYIEDDEDDYGFQDQGFFAGVGGDNMGVRRLSGLGLGLGLGLDGDGNDYASQLVSQPKRVKATFISFSKTAKKVDVKKLKDNIWKEMTQQSLNRQAAGDDLDRRKSKKKANVEDNEGEAQAGEIDETEEGEGVEYVKKEQRFTEIIGGLSKMYPEQKLKEISVPFCFICLLHLANEKNLSIEGTEGLTELVIRQP